MNIKIFLAFLVLILITSVSKPCNICGGGTGDIVVLALDGRALVNLGFTYDSYLGVWDSKGVWRETNYRKDQARFSLGVAYRLNKRLQFGASIPYVYNKHNVPGFPGNGSAIGDISLSGRYEIFHEFQLVKRNNKSVIDSKLPYLAITFGMTLPTGKSEENAKNEVDITGKGYFMSSLGVSVTKSIIKNRLQLSTDFSWQHGFKKTYEKYFGEELSSPFTKNPGNKFNYSVSLNYIFNNWHAVTLTASGFSQSSYYVNNNIGLDSDERNLSFSAGYTYYPALLFRITPSVKWTIPNDNFGKNATGSTTFTVNFTYYFDDYNIK
jgi:hypothetical protein